MKNIDDSKVEKTVYKKSKKPFPKNKFLCEPQLAKRGLYPHISKFDKNKSIKES